MKAKIAAIGVALLLVTAGAAAAAPGNAPDVSNADESNDEYDDEAEAPEDDARDDNETADNETESEDEQESEDELNETEDDEKERPDAAGPPTDMPEQAPDHVTEIHETITVHVDGALDGSLGDAISGIVGDDGADNESESADNESENANSKSENADNAGGGPPVDLPSAVPDRVTGVQDSIGGFLDGMFDGQELGSSLSGVGR